MYYKSLNETVKQPALLASLVGLINPVTVVPAIALGTGIAVLAAVLQIKKVSAENERLKKDKKVLEAELEDYACEANYEEIEDENEPYGKPLNNGNPTVQPTVPATVESYSPNGTGTVAAISDEDLRKEMIRQTMSELGRRSAAARAKKKHSA